MSSVPTIDIGRAVSGGDIARTVAAIDAAARTPGFFYVTGHGIDPTLIEEVWKQVRAFFALPIEIKRRVMRTKERSRGYYDRELTKNKRDAKEVFDAAHVPHPELPDGDPKNAAPVDGANQWPAELPELRPTLLAFMASLESVALVLLDAFALALGHDPQRLRRHFGPAHTSFIRLNHYPVADLLERAVAADVTPLGDMALHHHSDAGAFTLLLQDDVGGLQVRGDDGWIDVEPVADALVINTGDILQVWSNDRYRAAVHRVLPVPGVERFSLPYFFNPSYETDYAPLPGVGSAPPRYRTINWGAFRQARADGDYADYGAEVQIDRFRVEPTP